MKRNETKGGIALVLPTLEGPTERMNRKPNRFLPMGKQPFIHLSFAQSIDQ
jgi:hypothetical protein